MNEDQADMDKIEKIKQSFKDHIAEVAKTMECNGAQLSLGMSMALGSYIKFTSETEMVDMTVEQHYTMCEGAIKICIGKEPAMDSLKKLMH